MILRCIVCTEDIPELRARRNASTCSLRCQRELKRLKTEAAQRQLRGKTCPTCYRYIPRDAKVISLAEGVRLLAAEGHGNEARFI